MGGECNIHRRYKKCAQNASGNLKERDHLEMTAYMEKGVTIWTKFIWLKTNSYTKDNEHSGSNKGEKFIQQMSDYHILKDSATWSYLN
jgi:hypothetical protein